MILFPHPGYWTKAAIKKETQPIAVFDDAEEEPMNLDRGSMGVKDARRLLQSIAASHTAGLRDHRRYDIASEH